MDPISLILLAVNGIRTVVARLTVGRASSKEMIRANDKICKRVFVTNIETSKYATLRWWIF